jgi:SPP1 gp7 family putative phage head morphogenesis protein
MKKTTHDAKPNFRQMARNLRLHFMRVRNAERGYSRQLVGVARQVGLILRGFATKTEVEQLPALVRTLEQYGDIIEPWARVTANRMLEEVARRDANAWNASALEIGQNLRAQIESAPIGNTMQELLNERVEEIRSIPLEAASRVINLASEVSFGGRRSAEIAQEILDTEDVSIARARMLGRTSVATVSSTLVESRARYVGSPGYFWRTSKDSDVRRDHNELDGTFHRWDEPPIVDKRSGFRSHPGCNANCRCWPQVVLPEPESI